MNYSHYHERLQKYAETYKLKKLKDRGVVSLDNVTKKYVLYARKSTQTKEKQQKSIQDQIKECKEFALKNNISILQIFIDEQTARKAGKRTDFTEMLNKIKKGTFNSILSWHPDRLARNMREGGEIIDLIDKGTIVDLKFPSYTFVNDGSGKLALGIQFVLAKNYSDNLSVNTKRGNENRSIEGKGLRNDKWGYILDKNKYYSPDGDNFSLIKNIFQKAYQGDSVEKIANYLNSEGFMFNREYKKVTKQAVSRVLADPFYCGIRVIGNNVYQMKQLDSKFETCVSEEMFMQIRDIYKSRDAYSREYKRGPVTILLKNLVTCNYCGKKMYVVKNKGRGGRYLQIRCTNKECPRREMKIPREMRGKVVFDWLFELIDGWSITKENYNKWVKNVKKYRAESYKHFLNDIETIEKQILNKQEEERNYAIALGKLDNNKDVENSIQLELRGISDKIEELEKEKERLQVELSECLRDTDSKVWTYEKFVNFFKKLRTIVKNKRSELLLDKVSRMVIVNISLGDKEVVSYQLKQPFDTIEKLVTVTNGVEDGT